MIQPAPRLCKDCKWMRHPGQLAVCEAPRNHTEADILTGFEEESPYIYKWCSAQRQGPSISCGREGRWWESK